jgi:hypothetical protein
MLFDASAGRPFCKVALQYPAPCVDKWMIKCDVCRLLAMVTAAGRSEHRVPRSKLRDGHDPT